MLNRFWAAEGRRGRVARPGFCVITPGDGSRSPRRPRPLEAEEGCRRCFKAPCAAAPGAAQVVVAPGLRRAPRSPARGALMAGRRGSRGSAAQSLDRIKMAPVPGSASLHATPEGVAASRPGSSAVCFRGGCPDRQSSRPAAPSPRSPQAVAVHGTIVSPLS
jgi:hypothetical protein